MALPSKSDLLREVLDAIRESGWKPIVIDSTHPFRLRASNEDRKRIDLRIYIWNCTHGGGNRAADEFRIQITSSVPSVDDDAITLLLGWHDEKRVFAAWDIAAHDGQASSSPSAQVKEDALDAAAEKAFAIHPKGNEIVVAVRPDFLIDYALARSSLHAGGAAGADAALLNDLPELTDEEIDGIGDSKRRKIIRTITTHFRAKNFRKKVLKAYGHRCAFCRVQLSLLDAAHIIPVNAPGSTDEVVNGIALCKLHHFAYDSNLVSFDANYQIQVSGARLRELASRQGGLPAFRAGLERTLSLPARASDHPRPDYIRASRRIRGWRD